MTDTMLRMTGAVITSGTMLQHFGKGHAFLADNLLQAATAAAAGCLLSQIGIMQVFFRRKAGL